MFQVGMDIARRQFESYITGEIEKKKKDLLGWLPGSKEGQEIADEAKEKRTVWWREAGWSFMVRQFPELTAWWEVGASALETFGLKEEDPESYELMKQKILGFDLELGENEIETFLALAQIMPNEWKRYYTDKIAGTPYFNQFVKFYCDYLMAEGINTIPLVNINLPEFIAGNNIEEEIIQNKDPDAIVTFLRILHQDIVTGTSGIRDILAQFGIIKLK